jgi:predicted ATPase/DNA-binding CsgD family transcriptional regulator
LSDLIGRNQELNTLEQALGDVSRGIGRCLLLTGEAGIGKSRLVEELKHQAASEKFTILQGNCFEQNLSFPYAPWIDALRAYFAPLDATQIKKLLGPLAPEFMKLLPELAWLIPYLQPSPSLEPLAEKYRLFESFTRLVSSLSSSNPVLFILEDLHWGDALSLELVQYFVRRLQQQPLMLIGTYRSEELSPHLVRLLSELNRERLIQEIGLKSLNRDEVEQMARALLKTQPPIPSSFVDAVMALTDGNPFFVEEILKDLMEEGHIDELLRQKSLDELPVPHSIQRMVQQRVEQLPETTRRILICASVIGQRFDFGLLQETTAQSEQDLLQALKESISANLIVQESADQFAFKHALTHDAVYSMLMLRESKALHRTVGEALERLAGRRIDALAAQLAYHFYQAGVWQKAMEYSRHAGEQAQALYAPREAITHFTRAIDAARQSGISPPRSSMRDRAQAYEVLGDFDRARSDYEIALELARQGLQRADEWQSLIDLGFLWQSRDLVRAGEYFERGHDLARSLEENALIAQSLTHIGHWHVHGGQPREALSDHQQALELFRELNDRRGMAQTLELLGLDSYVLGEVVQGAAYCEEAVPILRALDDRQGLVNTLTTLCMRPRFDTEVLGEIDLYQLVKQSGTALEIARSCDYPVGEAGALHEGAVCLCRAGEYGQGLEYLRHALSIAEEIDHRELLVSVHHAWGSELYLGLLAFAEAREHLETARTAAQERGSLGLTYFVTARLATSCILQNDLARAQALLDGILQADLPDVRGMTSLLRSCWVARAELELALGNPARALEIIGRLLASTANLAQYGPQSVPRLSQLRGQALVTLGRIEEAVAEFQGAQTVAQNQGQRPMLWRLHADLGNAYRALSRHADAESEFSLARTIIQDLAGSLPEGTLRNNFVKQALAMIPVTPALTPRQAAMKEFSGLTEREREVAALIAQGKSNREIAEMLVVTVRTIEAHITRILDKLGFKSRTEIATWAVAKGLVHMRDDSVS